MAVKNLSPEAYRMLCRCRAKALYMRALKLTPTSFSVPSRNERPGDYYIVVTTPQGQPVGCIMDGESCKGFQYNGYCIHAGATENSIERRSKRPTRAQARPAARELTSKARARLLKRIEELEAMGDIESSLKEVKQLALV